MPARKAAQPDGTATPAPASQPTPRRPRRATAAPVEPPPAAPDEVAEAPAIHEDSSWVEADAVEVHQGAVGRVDATDVRVSQGAIGAARADRVSVQMGVLGAAMGRDVSISQGGAGSILTQHAIIDQSLVRTLVAQEVEFRRPSAVLVLIAQRVSGDVRVLLDWRAALAFGAAFGVIAGLFGRGRRGR